MRTFQYIISLVLWAQAVLVGAATYSNPLKAESGSDPHIVYTGGYYYLMTTTWTNLQITRATTLNGLKNGENKVVWTDSNASRCCNVWAPELHYLDGRWYIYYSAGTSANLDGQRSHVLRGGASPWESFTYLAQLTTEWGIDGTILRFSNYGNFFVYSCFPSANLQSLCIAPLVSPGQLGARKVLSTPTNSWEKVGNPVMEGPAAMYHGGKTFLAYSASSCQTAAYSIGLLTWNGGDPTLQNSWSKSGPHFTSANGNYGPAHNGFFQSPDGTQIWNVYHATTSSGGNCGRARYTMAQLVNWNSDGSPNFGTPVARGTTLQGPSGE